MMKYQITSFDLLKELLQKIPADDACMEWPRGKNAAGYGQLQTWDKTRETLVHRQSWVETFGPIPKAMGILHKCDNPPCFRPSHLFSGDQAANMADCATKKRVRGGGTKLVIEQVHEIRALLSNGVKQQAIAEHYDLHQSTVSDIKRGKRWHGV